MNYLRQFADAEVAMIVVAAVSRGKDSKGRSTYSGDALNLPVSANRANWSLGPMMRLSWCPTKTIRLCFATSRDAAHGCERPGVAIRPPTANDSRPPTTRRPETGGNRPGKLQSAWRSAWDRTPPADEDAAGFQGLERQETVNTEPPIIAVGQEPPPMHRPLAPARHQGHGTRRRERPLDTRRATASPS